MQKARVMEHMSKRKRFDLDAETPVEGNDGSGGATGESQGAPAAQVDATPERKPDPKAVTAEDDGEGDAGTGPEDEGQAQAKPDAKSLMDGIKAKATRGVADGAASFGEGAAATAKAGLEGLRNLPKAAAKIAKGLSASPVGQAASRAVTATASALGVSPKVAGASMALVAALVGGTGLTLAMGSNGFDPRIWVDDDCTWTYASDGLAGQEYGQGENQIPKEYGNGGFTVCVNLDTYNYGNTTQGKYQQMWKDQGRKTENGIPVIDGRYMIACTDTYGKMGDKVDFFLEDGTKLPCIIVEVKSQEKTWYDQHPANKWGHSDGQNVIEFQWCNDSPYASKHINPGNKGWDGTEEWGGKRTASWSNLGGGGDGDDSVIGGATSGSSSAARKAASNGMSDCAKRSAGAIDTSNIASTALSLAYSGKAGYKGGTDIDKNGLDGTDQYKKAYEAVWGGGLENKEQLSCDHFVATVVRLCGADEDIPQGAADDIGDYLASSDKWELVDEGSEPELLAQGKVQAGDVLWMPGHVAIWAGNDAIMEIYNKVIKGRGVNGGDIGVPADDDQIVDASIGDGNSFTASGARPGGVHPAYDARHAKAYRLKKSDNSDKYSDFSVVGLTTSNQSSIGACECQVKDECDSEDSSDGGSPDDSANADQKKVVEAAKSTASPGAGLCAQWVTDVFNAAGLTSAGGNACDMYAAFAKSSDKSELKVGMIIATPSWDGPGATDNSRTYGHVGIYVGDGKVMDNVGEIRTVDLDKWISDYGTTHTVKWGWLADKALSDTGSSSSGSSSGSAMCRKDDSVRDGVTNYGEAGSSEAVEKVKKYAKAKMKELYGWGDDQFEKLDKIWSQESGWNWTAENPSGAYGIPQSKPGNKMASEGDDWKTNPETQVKWGLKYIKDRYGDPAGAYKFKFTDGNGWY